jgi:hypothetical protein
VFRLGGHFRGWVGRRGVVTDGGRRRLVILRLHRSSVAIDGHVSTLPPPVDRRNRVGRGIDAPVCIVPPRHNPDPA